LNNTESTEKNSQTNKQKRWWTQVLRKGTQFLFY